MKFLNQFGNDIWYMDIGKGLNIIEYIIMAIFILEAILYWIDDFG